MAIPDPRCHINNKNKYVFINVSKNASTTIHNTVRFDMFSNYDTEKYRDYYKFIILRDPINRVISSYLEIIKLRTDGPFQITKNSKWFNEPDVTKSFTMFLDFIENNFYDSHILPQINFLKDKNLTINDMDCVLLHEKIKDDYLELIKSNKDIETLSHLKNLQVGNKQKKKILKEFVIGNKEIEQKVSEIYSEDTKMYNNFKNKQTDERFNRLHNHM